MQLSNTIIILTTAFSATSMALPIAISESVAVTTSTPISSTAAEATSASTDIDSDSSSDSDSDVTASQSYVPSSEELEEAMKTLNSSLVAYKQHEASIVANGGNSTDGVVDKSIGSWFKKHGGQILNAVTTVASFII